MMSSHRTVDPLFAGRMRELMSERGTSVRALAARTFYSSTHVHDLSTGRKPPTVDAAARIDEALGAGGELVGYVAEPTVDELAAVELSRRVAATDVGAETLASIERAVDELATAYARMPPDVLVPRARRHIAYVGRLMDATMTLAQRRRLLIAGGWLSLIGATLSIDLNQRSAAAAQLTTAGEMAAHAEHAEIGAWCLETQAWDVLTAGNYPRAVTLSQQAQAIAPHGSSAHIQATAQEGRAWARMGQTAETLDALNRTTRLVSPLPAPERPEHHYQYDPGKALAYTATTLSWVGDPAAVDCARDVVRQMESDVAARPRRAAAARLDLGLALLGAGRPDEAGAVTTAAIASGLLVPSNWWRATEIVVEVERAGVAEAPDLRDAYDAHQPGDRK